jgi:exosortase
MVTSQPAVSANVPEQPSSADSSWLRRIPRSLLGAAAILLSVCLWAYWSTFVELVHIWDSSPDYSHGYLVIPLALWFLWRRRDTLPFERLHPSWWGLSLILLAAGLRMVAARFYFPEFDGVSLPLWVAGILWLLGGGALARWAAPALAFLLFLVPLPASIETLLSQPMQAFATSMSTWVLQCLGQPAIAEGTTILLDENILEVERACSGLRMFYGILALAVAYIIVTRARLNVALILLAAVAPVAMAANVMRITATGLLYQYVSGDAARHFSHDLAGLLMIVLAVALFGCVLWVAQKVLRQFRRSPSRAMIRMAVALLLAAAAIPAATFWHEAQQNRSVDKFLHRADQLEQEGKSAEALVYLDRYLRVRDNIDVRVRLAETADRVISSPLRRLHVMEIYRETWQRAPEKIELGVRAGDIGIDLNRFDESVAIADQLDAANLSNPAEATKAKAAAARIRALALLGRANAPDVVGSASEWEEIVAAFNEAIKSNPHDIDLAVRLADVERHRLRQPAAAKRQKQADAVIDAMLARSADRPEAWLARYVYRKSLKAAGEPVSGDGDADLDKAIEIGKQHPEKERGDVLLYAGQRASDRKETAIAKQFFEKATQVRPTDFRGWLRLGELAAADGTDASRSQAIDIWTKGLESVGHCEIDLVMPLSAALIQLKRFADAEERLRPIDLALQRLSEPGRSLVGLGAVRLRAGAAAAKGNPVQAATMLRDELHATRDGSASTVYRTPFADAWMQLGDYYSDLRFDDQAADAYESAGRLDSQVPQWREKAARATERNGRPGESVQYYRELADANPTDGARWLAVCRASFMDQITVAPAERNWQGFREAFKKAIATKANGVMLYMLEADYAAAEGRYDESVKVLEKGIAKAPQASELWQSLALIHERRNDQAGVKKALAGFEKSAPTPESIPLFESRLAMEAGRLDEARTVLTKAYASLPETSKPLLNTLLVELDLRQGKRADARRRLEEQSAREPNNLQVLDTLAQIVADERDWKTLEEIEARLKKIEGDDGTLWRDYRARRLLSQSTDLDDPLFREADRLIREMGTLRPTWQRRYVLQGVLARRQNQLDEAIADYQQAIRLGNHNIGLSEELIDLLVEQRRFTEADREFQRVRQAVARSSRLSTVAIPLFVRRGESDEALRLAEDWVKREPTDAISFMRLGQTILLTTPEGSADYGKSVSRAQLAYERAVELAPTDVRMWISLFRFYTGVERNNDAADAMLSRLAKRIDIPEEQKVFVLAQLYESIGSRTDAARFYLDAIRLSPADRQLTVLERAAQFFVTDDPAQAEAYCRQILKKRPKSVPAHRTLVRALAEQGGEQRLREAAQVLTEVGRLGGSNAADRRLEAILLARTGRTEDRQRSAELLEGLVQIPQQAVDQDRVLLASIYESEHRLMPAYEQYVALSRKDDLPAIDLVRYAEFLYRNTSDQPQFADYAEPVLTRLERDPQARIGAVRLRLVAAGKIPQESKRLAKVHEVVEDADKRFVTAPKDAAPKDAAQKDAARKDETARREMLSNLLILLARENFVDEAVGLVTRKMAGPDALETAIALADALTPLPANSNLAKQTASLLRTALDNNPRSADLCYSVANLRYVTGSRDEAITLYRKALAIKPDHKLAANNLALVLADRRDGIAEALNTIDAAIAKFGADATLLDTKGQILVLLGRAQEALGLLGSAASSQPGDPLVLLHLSNAFLSSRREAEARTTYRRARAFGVATAVVTPADREILERLEAHVRQTAAAGG